MRLCNCITSQCWKIQSLSSSSMSLKTFDFLFFYFKICQFLKIQFWSFSSISISVIFITLREMNILKLPNFGRFNHYHLQVCHWKHFIFHFKNLTILKDLVMIIFKYKGIIYTDILRKCFCTLITCNDMHGLEFIVSG